MCLNGFEKLNITLWDMGRICCDTIEDSKNQWEVLINNWREEIFCLSVENILNRLDFKRKRLPNREGPNPIYIL